VASTVRLEIPPRRDHLALVRLVVSGTVAIERLLPERRVEDLRLAVTEACANAVDAAQAHGTEAPLVVELEVDDEAVAVTVTDRAGGFDLHDLDPLPAATDPQRLTHERGLGISLMRSLVDDVTFTSTEGGTAVRLVLLRKA
jgi:anti-sigma regulatory factor (Ser/Thr protein kinase)